MNVYKGNDRSVESIHAEILDILKNRFEIQKATTRGFFGQEGILNARSLVYLVHMLEEKYMIDFTSQDMDEDRFYTIDGMAAIIYAKINAKPSGNCCK